MGRNMIQNTNRARVLIGIQIVHTQVNFSLYCNTTYIFVDQSVVPTLAFGIIEDPLASFSLAFGFKSMPILKSPCRDNL